MSAIATRPAPQRPLPFAAETIAAALLDWYGGHRRDLPWRAAPGATQDPYRVWLSEIMLQQTTVTAVRPYYENFLARFPTVESLAAADSDAVMAAWAGLGYYARARNLHACARAVAERGGFPTSIEALRALPGIGAYTAAAVGAIAFGRPAVPVDGNVTRILTRLAAITAPLNQARAAIEAAASALAATAAGRTRAGDLAQALFDLGAGICTPAAPRCALCPCRADCAAARQGLAEALPNKPARAARPRRFGVHFWLEDHAGRVLLRRRPPRGLLGGMNELPGPAWRATPYAEAEALAAAPAPAAWRRCGEVRHVFTHFELSVTVYAARVERIAAEGSLCPRAGLAGAALPSLMRKCAALAADRAANTPKAGTPKAGTPEAGTLLRAPVAG